MNEYLEYLNMQVNATASAYVKLYNEGARPKTLKAAKKASKEAVDLYNYELANEQYREWALEGNPVELAVRSRIIPGAIKVTFKEKDDVMGFTTKPMEYSVSLPEMLVVLGSEVFAAPDWFEAAEKLCSVIVNGIGTHSDNPEFEYKIAEASKAFTFPDGVDLLTDEGIITAFQQVIDKILFLPDENGNNIINAKIKVDETTGKHYNDKWTVIRESMTRADQKNWDALEVCNTTGFSKYLLNAMHALLTNSKSKISSVEYQGIDDLRTHYNASELKKPTTEAPEAGEVPETHKAATAEEKKPEEKKPRGRRRSSSK